MVEDRYSGGNPISAMGAVSDQFSVVRHKSNSEPAWLFGVDPHNSARRDSGASSSPAYTELWLKRRSTGQRLAVLAAIAAIYFFAGKTGFLVNHAGTSPIWLASGLAIASILLLGLSAWP